MFEYKDGLEFIHIDIEYVKALNEACSEVSYRDEGYERKPYIGILVRNGDQEYAIPLTSAKAKHLKWKYVESDRFLVYEKVKRESVVGRDIIKELDQPDNGEYVNRILSAIDLKKMIPVRDDVIHYVDFNESEQDSEDEAKYKKLVNKEYSSCLRLKDDILQKAEKLYLRQIETGKVGLYCCDFLVLEEVCMRYSPNEKSVDEPTSETEIVDAKSDDA